MANHVKKITVTREDAYDYMKRILTRQAEALHFHPDRINWIDARVATRYYSPDEVRVLIAQPTAMSRPNVQVQFDKTGYTVHEEDLDRAVHPSLVARIEFKSAGDVLSESLELAPHPYLTKRPSWHDTWFDDIEWSEGGSGTMVPDDLAWRGGDDRRGVR
jgi:hypothetical protein